MAEEPKAEISIRLRSYDIDTMGAHHNAVAVYVNNEEAFTIHGLAMKRETGEIVAVGNREDTLRALVLPSTFNHVFDLPINGEHVIYEGSLKDSLPKIAAALDAVNFINAQNLNYDAFELFKEAQNSNSVAHTIVKAMGEKFPEESERYWAPGHGRILLPKDWTSLYLMVGTSEESLNEALNEKNLQKVSIETVVRQAMDDPTPKRKNIFFDSEKPFAPYVPLAQEEQMNADTTPQPTQPATSHNVPKV